MPVRTLPSNPSLVQLKLQAKELQKLFREQKQVALARITAHHPRFKKDSPRLALADAQMVLAREYGFANWAQLKHFVELSGLISKIKPHPHFEEAVAALDAGDLPKLRRLLKTHPDLVRARGYLNPPYGYFTGATLLHHVAGNPIDEVPGNGSRAPLPENIVDVARLLLESGAEADAPTMGPRVHELADERNSGTTMGLVMTSQQASERDVSGPIMDLLLKYGAKLDLRSPGVLDVPLIDHAPRAAEKMLELGAKPDVCNAGALGRMELLRDCFDDQGHLRERPRRHGKVLSERDAIGLALLFAYVNNRPKAVDFLLEKDGNWNMIGVNNGTALHRAANAGDLEMVKRLVAKGADISNRENPFNATPYSWADHFKVENVMQWMRANCTFDIHDAVSFNAPDHAARRIKEDPQCVNAQLDQWQIPRATPLHMAALLKHAHLAKLLLDNGADPNIVAGNGRTPLDIAIENGATEVAKLLEGKGGKRAAEL
jgi:ankyrin repeat protein